MMKTVCVFQQFKTEQKHWFSGKKNYLTYRDNEEFWTVLVFFFNLLEYLKN